MAMLSFLSTILLASCSLPQTQGQFDGRRPQTSSFDGRRPQSSSFDGRRPLSSSFDRRRPIALTSEGFIFDSRPPSSSDGTQPRPISSEGRPRPTLSSDRRPRPPISSSNGRRPPPSEPQIIFGGFSPIAPPPRFPNSNSVSNRPQDLPQDRPIGHPQQRSTEHPQGTPTDKRPRGQGRPISTQFNQNRPSNSPQPFNQPLQGRPQGNTRQRPNNQQSNRRSPNRRPQGSFLRPLPEATFPSAPTRRHGQPRPSQQFSNLPLPSGPTRRPGQPRPGQVASRPRSSKQLFNLPLLTTPGPLAGSSGLRQFEAGLNNFISNPVSFTRQARPINRRPATRPIPNLPRPGELGLSRPSGSLLIPNKNVDILEQTKIFLSLDPNREHFIQVPKANAGILPLAFKSPSPQQLDLFPPLNQQK